MKEAKTDLEISHAFNIFIYAFVCTFIFNIPSVLADNNL